MIESMFSDDIKMFLGKYKVVTNQGANYNVVKSISIKCEDGRIFEQDRPGYGTTNLDLYAMYQTAINGIVQKVEDAYAQTLPYMDRMMRKL